MNIQSSMHESNTSRSKRATKCSIPRSTPIKTENILRTRHQMTLLGIICYVITVWLDATGYMILAFLMLDTKASYGHVWWRRQTLFPILTIPYIQTRKMIVFIKLLEILSLSLSLSFRSTRQHQRKSISSRANASLRKTFAINNFHSLPLAETAANVKPPPTKNHYHLPFYENLL